MRKTDLPIIALPAPDAATDRGLAPYIRAIEEAGGACRVVRPAEGVDIQELMRSVQGLYLIAGADIHPSRYGEEPDPQAGLVIDEDRDALEFPLIKAALDKDLPVLGICRGMQLLNVALGGKLIQDVPEHRAPEGRPEFHGVHIVEGSRLAGIIGVSGDVRVNSRHHQAVRPGNKAPQLEAAAYRREDGVIEALESRDHRWVIGVQSHPQRKEEMPPELGRLFEAFVEAARGMGV